MFFSLFSICFSFFLCAVSKELRPQQATLTISFYGNLNNQTASGFFISDNVFDPSSLNAERKEAAFKGKFAKQAVKQPSPLTLKANEKKMYATQVCFKIGREEKG